MASRAGTQTAVAPTTNLLEERFRGLEAMLLDEVEDISCEAAIVHHPVFREILSLGETVVPLLLRDLGEGPRPWVWALPELTGANPVSPADAGKVANMGLAWLRWARENGYQTKGIEDYFPGLRGRAYEVIGPPDPDYNCFAWAIGVTDSCWSPTGDPQKVHWPAGVPREKTLAAAQTALESLGYAVCDHTELEHGYVKVALFHNPAQRRIHVARQLPSGRWTSKLGILELIEHVLRDLEGAEYGSVAVVMKRQPSEPPNR